MEYLEDLEIHTNLTFTYKTAWLQVVRRSPGFQTSKPRFYGLKDTGVKRLFPRR